MIGIPVLMCVDMFVVFISVQVVTLVEMEIWIGLEEMKTVVGVRGEVVDGETTVGARGVAFFIEVLVVWVGLEEEMTTTVFFVRVEAFVLQFVIEDIIDERILNLKY